jgi:hypothetical protein
VLGRRSSVHTWVWFNLQHPHMVCHDECSLTSLSQEFQMHTQPLFHLPHQTTVL